MRPTRDLTGMRTYLAKRLLLIVPTLLGAAALVFLIMRVIPGT
jgi:ABC-type microcin C transport system permease subunit YejB